LIETREKLSRNMLKRVSINSAGYVAGRLFSVTSDEDCSEHTKGNLRIRPSFLAIFTKRQSFLLLNKAFIFFCHKYIRV